MSSIRSERINKSVAQELNDIIRNVKDPRVSSSYVTINSAEVTNDLKLAKIFFGCITGDPAEVKKGLQSAKGFLRRELAVRLNMRQTPELSFYYDDGAERGARIARILNEIEEDNKEQ